MASIIAGGCQCGAVRYAVGGTITDKAICHCRMCQKAVGSISWPFFTVGAADLTWTRGAPALYRSSQAAERGFCSACGTPLSFQPVGGDTVDISIGSLDRPEDVEPTVQYWADRRVSWFDRLAALPAPQSSASPEELERRRPYQHPDHDTSEWQP